MLATLVPLLPHASLLLCRQPLPPDTVEHAAALYAFVDAARDQVLTECERQPQFFRNCTSILSTDRDKIISLPKEQPLAEQLTKLQTLNPQKPWGSTESDLAPHVDLQLQPPSHLLLELLLLQLQGDEAAAQQFRNRYELDAEQMDGLEFLMAADESFAWMHQIAQQVQQQQQQQQQQGCADDDQQQAQQQQQTGQQDSCSGSSAGVGEAAAAQPAPTAAAAAGVRQVLGQLHQQRDNHPHTADMLQQLPAPTDAASLAANLVQMLAQGSFGETGGGTALDERTSRQLVQQLRVLGGALVLQFVSAARAAGGPAWQQEVPLQAVVLFGALEQMQGLALAYLNHCHVVEAAAEAGSSDTKRPQQQQQQQQNNRQANGCHNEAADAATRSHSSSPSLQQMQHLDADAVSSDSDDKDSSNSSSSLQQAGLIAAHSQPASALMRVVRKLQDLLQMLQQFRDANAALNAAAAADPSADVVTARYVLPVTPDRGLAPCELFLPRSPLQEVFPEPCGHGIWAPGVAADTAAAAAAGAEAQVKPGSSSSSSSESSWAAGNSSSSGSHWFTKTTLAALAGAGQLTQCAHMLLLHLHDELATGDMQQKLVEDVVQTLQMLTRCSRRDERLFGRQSPQQQELSAALQQLQHVCQQHGVELPAELLHQLSEVPSTVLHCLLGKVQQVADASGVDVQRSSSFRHGWNRREVSAMPGDAAITEGKKALW
jgi:hypothetical protein